ncbi:MAG: DUF6179 domain-containing protein [Lachnospiraceae bacterium]|nr:DUF6179 domain-containing protein [Lachnospiraceae bacterium]
MKKISYEIEELFPVVAMLAEQYTGYESTSVTYEKAQQFMEAVIYGIHAYEKTMKSATEKGMGDASGNALAGQRIPAKEAYRNGVRILQEKVKQMLAVYHAMLKSFQSYGNHCLEDTILKGIPEFARWYDVKYAPQDTILTLDYPVLVDLSSMTGIDKVYAYVKAVSIEQRFLAGYGESRVQEILNAYTTDYTEMIENISSIVLQDTVEQMLQKGTFSSQNFTQKKKFNTDLQEMIATLINRYYDGNKEMMDYFSNDIDNLRVRILIHYE